MDVIYVDDFLDEDTLLLCQNYIDKISGQGIFKDKKFVSNFWDKNKVKLQSINPNWVGLYDDVTKTNNSKPVDKHFDKKINNEKYKMFIYLNEVENGGTIFIENGVELLIENKLNRLVVFNIKLKHQGQNFLVNKNKVNKKLIGFRIKEKYY